MCPSIGDPLGVMIRVSRGAGKEYINSPYTCFLNLTINSYRKSVTPDSPATPHCLTHILSIARRCSLPERSEGEGG